MNMMIVVCVYNLIYVALAFQEKANPGKIITTSDVWLETHKQTGGTILPSAQPYYVSQI